MINQLYLYEVYSNADAFEYHRGTPHIKKWQETSRICMMNRKGQNGRRGKIFVHLITGNGILDRENNRRKNESYRCQDLRYRDNLLLDQEEEKKLVTGI